VTIKTPIKLHNTIDPVHVLGASGRIGQAVCRQLLASGVKVVPLVRNPERWRTLGIPAEPRAADLMDDYTLRLELADASRLLCCVSQHHLSTIIASTNPDVLLVLIGDARRYLQAPDIAGLTAMEGERMLIGSGRPGVILHPSMIYGLPSHDPAKHWASMLRMMPLLPLTNAGDTFIQPIALDDVVRCVLAALDRNWSTSTAVAIAGPEPMTVEDFLLEIAKFAGVKMPYTVPVPQGLMSFLSPFTAAIPSLRLAVQDDLYNLAEDRIVDISRMISELGVTPMSLSEGLAPLFRRLA